MKRSKKGSVLAITIGLTTVFTIFGLSSLYFGTLYNDATSRNIASNQAFWLAEAGIQNMLWEINVNGESGLDLSSNCSTCTNCGDKCLRGTLVTSPDCTGALCFDHEVWVNNGLTTIISKGYAPFFSAASMQKRSIQADIIKDSLFSHAVFADHSVKIDNNAVVDSFDSVNGDYGGTNIGKEGDVGTNGTQEGAITIANNAEIHGEVSTGPGGTIEIKNINKDPIDGEETHNNYVYLPPVVIPESLASKVSDGVYSVGIGETTTIDTGEYKYDEITLANDATLNISGNVTVYLTGGVDGFSLSAGENPNAVINITSESSLTVYADGKILFKNNGLLNSTGYAENLMIYSTYSGVEGVVVQQNDSFSGAIYAPDAGIIINQNGAFIGSVVGEDILISENASVHYDKALDKPNPWSRYVVWNWLEI